MLDNAPSADVSMPVISVLSMSETSEPRLNREAGLAAGDTDAPAPTMRGAACRSALAFWLRDTTVCANFRSWMITCHSARAAESEWTQARHHSLRKSSFSWTSLHKAWALPHKQYR